MITTDDNTAINVLKTSAQARLQPASDELALAPDLCDALTSAFGDPPQSAISEGELARAALTVLAEDPAYAEPIKVMTSQPEASFQNQRYFEPATIALTTAVLLVLQPPSISGAISRANGRSKSISTLPPATAR